MKPHRKSLGCNALSDAPYRNPGMVLNGQGSGHHLLGGTPYLDLDTVLNKQGSGHHIVMTCLFVLLGSFCTIKAISTNKQ
jgi:hypothetical protein